MTPPRLSEVECLRGLAIVLVLVHHANGIVNGGLPLVPGSVPWPLPAVVLGGHTGVSLFFVLSGFLLSRPFLAEARGGPRVRRAGYAVRRLLRVMPLYVVAVLVGSIATARRPADVLHAAPYLAFLNALPDVGVRMWPFNDVWWSLATEAQFYLLLPFLPLVLCSARGRRVGLALLAAYAVGYGALAMRRIGPSTLSGELALAQSLVGRAPLFMAGIAAAMLFDRYAPAVRDVVARAGWRGRLAGDALLLATLATLAALLTWVVREPYVTREAEWPVWHGVEGALWAVVLLLLLVVPGFSKRILVNPVWGFLGLVSYSLYLVHMPMLVYGRRAILQVLPGTFLWLPGRVPGWTPRAVVGAAVIAMLTIAVSTLTYAGIERPMLRMKRRVRRS